MLWLPLKIGEEFKPLAETELPRSGIYILPDLILILSNSDGAQGSRTATCDHSQFANVNVDG